MAEEYLNPKQRAQRDASRQQTAEQRARDLLRSRIISVRNALGRATILGEPRNFVEILVPAGKLHSLLDKQSIIERPGVTGGPHFRVKHVERALLMSDIFWVSHHPDMGGHFVDGLVTHGGSAWSVSVQVATSPPTFQVLDRTRLSIADLDSETLARILAHLPAY